MTSRTTLQLFVACLVVSSSATGCKKREEPTTTTSATTEVASSRGRGFDPLLLAPFQPVPEVAESKTNPITEDKITLGRMLYFDPRLSKNHDVSCESCHHLTQYGVDNEPTSTGHKGQRDKRNAPTVYNAALHFRQFWDGRAPDVEEQAKVPMTDPVEMAMPTEQRIVQTLGSIPGYVDAFQKAFSGDKAPVTLDNAAKAIGAFERKLLTPSRWDDLLKGKQEALSAEEIAGLRKFVEVGCQTCHSGPGMGGGMYQKFGVVMPWQNANDLGRYEVTKQDTDRMFFKVPSLRNVEKTAPYLHDGSVKTLDEAVLLMGRHQLGKELSEADVRSIVTFLHSLTGPLPQEYIQKPQLPPSSPSTPRPEPD